MKYTVSNDLSVTVSGLSQLTGTVDTNSSGQARLPFTAVDPSGAGTISVKYDWALGSASSGTTNWLGIYIDDPNHQDFNHKTFTTACTSP